MSEREKSDFLGCRPAIAYWKRLRENQAKLIKQTTNFSLSFVLNFKEGRKCPISTHEGKWITEKNKVPRASPHFYSHCKVAPRDPSFSSSQAALMWFPERLKPVGLMPTRNPSNWQITTAPICWKDSSESIPFKGQHAGNHVE